MSNRTFNERKHYANKVIKKRKNIVRNCYRLKENVFAPKNDKNCNSYSKNKVHCSCSMCSTKEKYRGEKIKYKKENYFS